MSGRDTAYTRRKMRIIIRWQQSISEKQVKSDRQLTKSKGSDIVCFWLYYVLRRTGSNSNFAAIVEEVDYIVIN